MTRRAPGLRIEPAGPEAAEAVCRLVDRLLAELGEEGDETGALDATALAAGWRALSPGSHTAILAIRDEAQSAGEGATLVGGVALSGAVGVVTVVECFALYAGGRYGILNEMYVVPEARSSGVGAALIAAVKEMARARGWQRVDVTAPEAARWERTRRFYERQGFVFTGPKLKWRTAGV